MIKIIKAGTRKKIECLDCGALLSYDDEDIKIITNLGKRFIECPQCKSKIFLRRTYE